MKDHRVRGVCLSLLLAGGVLSAMSGPLGEKTESRPTIDESSQVYEADERVLAEFTRIAGELKPRVAPARPRRMLVYGVSHGPHRFVIPTAEAKKRSD